MRQKSGPPKEIPPEAAPLRAQDQNSLIPTSLDHRGPQVPPTRVAAGRVRDASPSAGPSHGLRGQARSPRVAPFYAAVEALICFAVDS